MELGWLDVCLNVGDVRVSRRFYEGLGFRRVEGDDEEGWAVVFQGEARIGLFEPRYMKGHAFSLNFRGGDVSAVAKQLNDAGYRFEKPLAINADGGASATMKDPDGHVLFFDSAPNETKKT